MQSFPQPGVRGIGFHFFGHFAREFSQGRFREFGSGSAIVTRVRRWSLFSNQKTIAHHSSHRTLTGCFFTITQHLPEKRPQHHSCVVNAVDPKQSIVLRKDLFDAFGGKQTGERQSGLSKKRIHHTLKTGAAWTPSIWYV